MKLEDFQNILSEEWHEDAYKNTIVKVGNPLSTAPEVTKVVLVEEKDKEMLKSIQRLYTAKFPELGDCAETFDTLEKRVRYGSGLTKRQKVIKMPANGNLEVLLKYLRMVREKVSDAACEVAFHHIDDLSVTTMRKVLEIVFRGTNCMVSLYTTMARVNEEEGIKTAPPLSEKKKSVRSYALIVGQEGKKYEEVLGCIKASITSKEDKENIKNVRKTRDGKIVITMKENEQSANNVMDALNNTAGNMRIMLKRPKADREIVHLRGMDLLVTQGEIQEVILDKAKVNKIEIKGEDVMVGQLRPNVGDTLAATVTLPKAVADLLIKEGHLRIGLLRCSVKRRVEVRRCGRCWSYDHSSGACQGPDRRKLCFKCGKEGHIRANCGNHEKCILCNTAHVIGSGKCIAFKKALQKRRQCVERLIVSRD